MARRYQKPPAGDTSEEAMIQFGNWLAEDVAALPSGAMEDRLIGIASRRDDQDPLDKSSEVERRINSALHAIMPAWQPTAADHQWLLDALEHTPQDEPLPP